jgi:hypothetical protein
VLAALLLAAQAVRNAAVAQFAELQPARAGKVWPGHPLAELTIGLTEIATASRQHKPVAPATFARINDAARKMPLAPEPFLVRGVQAQLDGDRSLAGEVFRAAELRDGRAIPARYFLAEHYFRTGDARSGLREVAALSRLVPNGVGSLAPYVAAYSKNSRNWPALRALFKSDPALQDATLSALSADPRNADLVLALGEVRNRPATAMWPDKLVASLVAAQQYGKARAVWTQIAGLGPGDGIFDPGFTQSTAPPPFNWELTSSTVGLAERRHGLHVIFYGQEDGPLASQLLLLAPGAYRLAMPVTGDTGHARSLVWTLTCANSNTAVGRFALEPAAAAQGWVFSVPTGCPAQKLELSGVSADMPQQVDVTIPRLRLERQRG